MGKAQPLSHKFRPDGIDARVPQSFRSGVIASEHLLLGGAGASLLPAANSGYHPLRDGEAAAQEDAYWHAAFLRERYYVPGRGYDQYRPAYAMGWEAAFEDEQSSFAQIEAKLEHRWEAYHTSSLLDWSEVRDAVHAAWKRGRDRQGQPVRDGVLYAVKLRPLRTLQWRTARDLQMLLGQAEPPPTAFVCQVVERHAHMLHGFSEELPSAKSVLADWREPFWRVGVSFSNGWMWLRSKTQDLHTVRILQLCDEREQQLLRLYAETLADGALPSDLSGVLQRQYHQLQLHHDKLQWVRQHWMAADSM